MAQLPCKQCGTLIMDFTFRENDGRCMVCAKGFKCRQCGKMTLSGGAGMCSPCWQKSRLSGAPDREEFDHELMLKSCLSAIEIFASEHAEETFYAFAIDADMLCLNSEEAFEKTLRQYEEKWPAYRTDEKRRAGLRMSTGDWVYQGFFTMVEKDGFCSAAYSDHCSEASENEAAVQSSKYAKAMNKLIAAIDSSGILGRLRRTSDFRLMLVEHEY